MTGNSGSDNLDNIVHHLGSCGKMSAEIGAIATAAGFGFHSYRNPVELIHSRPRHGIVVMHDALPERGLAHAIDSLVLSDILLPVVLASHSPRPARIVDGIKCGATDYLALPVSAEGFARRLAKVAAGAADIAASHRKRSAARQRLSDLSRREREVLQWISLGNSSKAIARQLEISPRTVEVYRSKMLSKLGVNHALEAVRICFDAGEASMG